MSNYGRNFEFRIPPEASARSGRYCTHTDQAAIPIGAPVIVDTAVGENALGLKIVKLAPEGTTRGSGANKGILVYEWAPDAWATLNPDYITYSDQDTAPPGAAIQLVAGDPATKVCLRNTVDRVFLQTRAYLGRTMVAGMGATPTVIVGQFLTPGVGTTSGGFWKPTATEADGWLEVTKVDTVRGEVEARALF